MGRKVERLYVVDTLKAYVDFDGMSLDGLAAEAARLKDMIVKEGGVEDSGFISYEHYGYDGAFEVRVKYRRLESDKEFEKRVADEAKAREKERVAKEKRLERERKEYERLRKKFEKEKG